MTKPGLIPPAVSSIYPYICLAVFFIGSWRGSDRATNTPESDFAVVAHWQPALGQQPVPHRRALFVLRSHLHADVSRGW